MREIDGAPANAGGGKKIHDHSFEYGTTSIKDSILIEAKSAGVVDGVLVAYVIIKNGGAGHFAPTGTPARSLVLEATTFDAAGKPIESKKTVYSKAVLAEDGKGTVACADAYLHGCKAGRDNRLAPGESRVETFKFALRLKNVASVEARAYFMYQPYVMMRTNVETPLSSSSFKIVRPENEETKN
jgi:hypothetical protein